MLPKEEKLIISFDTTTMALAMEKKCKSDSRNGRIIPLPREISAGCGLAWATNRLDTDEWKEYMNKTDILYADMKVLWI